MQPGNSPLRFAIFVACAVAFVGLTSNRLPAMVASHFAGSGAANGFMPHAVYVGFMLAFVVGLPVLMVVVTWFAIARPDARINLPNKDYWLAPAHRAQTIGYLRSGVLWFGTLLVALLCYMHWLVVLANEVRPPRLSNSWFIGGLVVFVGAVLFLLKVFLLRFRHGG